MRWRLGLTLVGFASAVACSAPPAPPPLIVFAASSLAAPLEELAALHEQRGRQIVRLHLGASGTLARQIVEGAPADLFISADARVVDQVQAAASGDGSARVVVASNRLALVVLRDRVAALPSLEAVLGARRTLIGVGDPDVVPLGRHTREWLTRQGHWDGLLAARRLVLAPSAQAVVAQVMAGATDAAVVFRSDVHRASALQAVFDVPREATDPIQYVAIIIASSPHRQAAQLFLDVLAGPEGQVVLADAGFDPATPAQR